MKGLNQEQRAALSSWIAQALGRTVESIGPADEKNQQRIKCVGDTNPDLKVTLDPFEGGTLIKLFSFSDSWLDESPTGEKDIVFRWYDGENGERGELAPVKGEAKVQIMERFNELETKDLAEERVIAREKMGAFQREFKTPENTGGKCAYLIKKKLTLPPSSEAYILKMGKTPSTQANPEGTRLYEALMVPYSPSFEDRTPTAIQYRRSGKSKAMSLPGVKQKEAFCILQKGEPIHGTNKHVILLSESASTGLALANAAKDTTVICCISISEILNTYNIIKKHYGDTAIIVPALDKLEGFKESSENSEQFKLEKYFADNKVPFLQLNKHEEEYKDMTDFHDYLKKYGLPSLRAYLTQFLKRITPEAPEVSADKGKAYELVNFNGVKQSIDKHLHFLRDIKECMSQSYLDMIWKSDPTVKTDKELEELKSTLKAEGKVKNVENKMKQIRKDNEEARITSVKNQLNLQLGKQKSGGRAAGIFKGTERGAYVANAEFGTLVLKDGQIRTSARRRPEGTHYYKDFSQFDAPDVEASVFNKGTLKELNSIWNSVYGKKDSAMYMPIMGWAAQACLAGIGNFRAHAAINGVTGAGKTTLAQQFLEPLLCGLFRFFPKATAAGINQVISTKDVYKSHQVVCLDEFDRDTQENRKLHDAVSAQKKISATTMSNSPFVQGSKDGAPLEREVRQAYMTTATTNEWADLQQKKRDILFFFKDRRFASQNLALEALPSRILNVRAGFVKGIFLSAEYYTEIWKEVREQLNHYVEEDAQMSHMIAMITCCLSGYAGLKLVAKLEELGLTKKDMLENPEKEKKHIQAVAKEVIRSNSAFIAEQMSHSNDLTGLRDDLALLLSTVNIGEGQFTKNLHAYLVDTHGSVDADNCDMTIVGQSGMFADKDKQGKPCIYILKQEVHKAKNFLKRVPTRVTQFALSQNMITDGENAGVIKEVKSTLPDKSRRAAYKVNISFDLAPEKEGLDEGVEDE